MAVKLSTAGERTPGMKLLLVALVGAVLVVPLLLVYALVYDRKSQSETARATITQGWGGEQTIAGPVVVIPYRDTQVETSDENGLRIQRSVDVIRELYLSPLAHSAVTRLAPERRRKSIYESVLYDATVSGKARFALPADLARFGVAREALLLDRAELRFGVSDARGLRPGSTVTADGEALTQQPGKGLAATGGAGFFAFVAWDGAAPLEVAYSYGLRGSGQLALVPRGGSTRWQIASRWPHPSFAGSFLPDSSNVTDAGFEATYSVDKLALGQAPVMTDDPGPPIPSRPGGVEIAPTMTDAASATGPSRALVVALIEPVDLYSQVDRAVKYGFLFIGFTFLAFLMFDLVGGARVAPAEYLLTGAGLVLFFVLLLAFAEVIGFTAAYLLASAAIIGLLTAYSAAVLDSWRRAR
ncbi:MAG TPA: cell envelope integrity protein CreD, partial [Novosphingobium sp.]|nr:cell envelope integrity protein CreD [Novosphingobium sp.]